MSEAVLPTFDQPRALDSDPHGPQIAKGQREALWVALQPTSETHNLWTGRDRTEVN